LATGGDGRELSLWDIASGEKLLTLAGQPYKIRALAFCGPRRLAAAGTDNLIHVWDMETGTELLTLRGHEGSVSSLAYDVAEDALISGSYDTTVRVWRLGDDDGMARRPVRPRQGVPR
jgi:WD40 repeat protein